MDTKKIIQSKELSQFLVRVIADFESRCERIFRIIANYCSYLLLQLIKLIYSGKIYALLTNKYLLNDKTEKDC